MGSRGARFDAALRLYPPQTTPLAAKCARVNLHLDIVFIYSFLIYFGNSYTMA